MGVLAIFDGSPGDIWWVSWIYLMGVSEIFIDVTEIFRRCPGDI